ncbi:hypothetical protein [Sphingomonas aracearum]|uniref:Antifreeze glycopeptide polyprotein n=1 Tax=Sphingomonas aracearum TaxID=2283317 RepID=A0A369VWG7_9SPHN|nr:hypothetical protein [Sphingomonas aracearum]RDE06463.1 hypothetical protein DVW87_01750 [Sphingomonas aracearum]
MRISRASAGLGALAAVIAAGLPALAQERPESILPPGFGDPVTTPPPPVARPTIAPRATPVPRPTVSGTPAVAPLPGDVPTPLPSASPSASPSPTPTVPAIARYRMPDYARRSLALVGVEGSGLPADAFGNADGRRLERLMRRIDTPLASRWLHIGLRRMLLAPLRTPRRVNGADFAAERAWLLLRMGEAPAARSVVQAVDDENYTPKLMQMAMQSALANGDPGALCAIADAAAVRDPERGWTLAQGMCAGITGERAKARAIFAAARRQRVARGVNLQLAQKVAGAGANGRQVITIEWAGVPQLTIWRFGLALATGVEIPPDLLASVGPQVRAWRATSPLLTPAQRAEPAMDAAARGVFSNAALVDLYAAMDEGEDNAAAAQALANRLRLAYTAAGASERLDALKAIWDEPKDAAGRLGRLVLTARAAARVPVGASGADADRLVAAMLTAGLDRSAARWSGTVAAGSPAWAMLALSDPDREGAVTSSSVEGFAGGRRRQMFFAALAGLGRMRAEDVESAAQSLDVRIGADNGWTRAIDAAAFDGEPATVLLLAAIGMQTQSWGGVPPEALYHVTAALRATGQEGLARMIAAEAIGQL